MNIIRKVRNRVALTTGLSFLSREFLSFVTMHGLFAFAANLAGLFISTFLLRGGSSMFVVGSFYLLCYGFEIIANTFVCSLAGRLSPTVITRMGITLYALSYLILLVMQENAGQFVPLVALLSAFGAGMYWLPYHYYTVTYTNLRNRQLGVSMTGFMASLIVLVTPPVSGLILTRMPGISGYTVVLCLSVAAFGVAMLVTRKMPSQPTGEKHNTFLALVRRDWKTPAIRGLVAGSVFFGIRDGVFMYYLTALIYTMLENEFVIGASVAARSVVAMGVFILLGRLGARWIARWGLTVGLLCAVLLSAGTGLWYTAVSILILNVLDAGVQSLLGNSTQIVTYQVTDYLESRDGASRKMEVSALRNNSFDLGRVFGMLIFLFFPFDLGIWQLLMLNVLSLPCIFFYRRTVRKIERADAPKAS